MTSIKNLSSRHVPIKLNTAGCISPLINNKNNRLILLNAGAFFHRESCPQTLEIKYESRTPKPSKKTTNLSFQGTQILLFGLFTSWQSIDACEFNRRTTSSSHAMHASALKMVIQTRKTEKRFGLFLTTQQQLIQIHTHPPKKRGIRKLGISILKLNLAWD